MLVLSLETRAGLAAARSLGRQGLRVAAAAWGRHAPGLRTRFARERFVLPSPEEGAEVCVDALARWLERHPTDAVLTSTDSGLTVLHEHRERLGALAGLAIPSAAAVETALSKQATLEVAERVGCPVPRSIVASTPDEVDDAVAEIGLPAVMKPFHQWRRGEAGSSSFEKPRLLENAEDIRAACAELVSSETPVQIQERVGDGVFEHHQFFRAEGRVLARITLGVERQWPPFGVSSLRVSMAPPPDTGPAAERLVEAIDIEGCSSVQFKRDGSGRPFLMEVNGRLVQSLAAAAASGVDFARMQLEWARGGSIPEANPRLGVRVGWLGGDLHLVAAACGLIQVRPKPALGRTVSAVAKDYLLGRAKVEGLDPGDVGPNLAALTASITGAARIVRGRAGGR